MWLQATMRKSWRGIEDRKCEDSGGGVGVSPARVGRIETGGMVRDGRKWDGSNARGCERDGVPQAPGLDWHGQMEEGVKRKCKWQASACQWCTGEERGDKQVGWSNRPDKWNNEGDEQNTTLSLAVWNLLYLESNCIVLHLLPFLDLLLPTWLSPEGARTGLFPLSLLCGFKRKRHFFLNHCLHKTHDSKSTDSNS